MRAAFFTMVPASPRAISGAFMFIQSNMTGACSMTKIGSKLVTVLSILWAVEVSDFTDVFAEVSGSPSMK